MIRLTEQTALPRPDTSPVPHIKLAMVRSSNVPPCCINTYWGFLKLSLTRHMDRLTYPAPVMALTDMERSRLLKGKLWPCWENFRWMSMCYLVQTRLTCCAGRGLHGSFYTTGSGCWPCFLSVLPFTETLWLTCEGVLSFLLPKIDGQLDTNYARKLGVAHSHLNFPVSQRVFEYQPCKTLGL